MLIGVKQPRQGSTSRSLELPMGSWVGGFLKLWKRWRRDSNTCSILFNGICRTMRWIPWCFLMYFGLHHLASTALCHGSLLPGCTSGATWPQLPGTLPSSLGSMSPGDVCTASWAPWHQHHRISSHNLCQAYTTESTKTLSWSLGITLCSGMEPQAMSQAIDRHEEDMLWHAWSVTQLLSRRALWQFQTSQFLFSPNPWLNWKRRSGISHPSRQKGPNPCCKSSNQVSADMLLIVLEKRHATAAWNVFISIHTPSVQNRCSISNFIILSKLVTTWALEVPVSSDLLRSFRHRFRPRVLWSDLVQDAEHHTSQKQGAKASSNATGGSSRK